MKNRNLKQDDIWKTPAKYYYKWNKEFKFEEENPEFEVKYVRVITKRKNNNEQI